MMKKGNVWLHFALIVVITFAMTMTVSTLAQAGDANGSKTLENLQAAYNGESNAHAKYLAYAKKAGEEGYLKVAALFRAAAYAEEVHLNNHAKEIKAIGASPKAEIKLPEIHSTEQNLADAIYAEVAEAEHAKLYTKALTNLNEWKVADAGFGVCPICGYTVEGKPTFKKCPLCGTPADDYKLVT
jgi:rubrerythrin